MRMIYIHHWLIIIVCIFIISSTKYSVYCVNSGYSVYSIIVVVSHGSVESVEEQAKELDQPRLPQIVDQEGVDKLVLSHRLHHQHPLLAQVGQHLQISIFGDMFIFYRATYLRNVYIYVVVCTVQQDVHQDSDASPPNACAAVHQHRGVAVLPSSHLAHLLIIIV